jgi:hypothetical protein
MDVRSSHYMTRLSMQSIFCALSLTLGPSALFTDVSIPNVHIRGSFFERPPAPTTFAIVAGVLKLSTKYDVEYLQHRALLHVSAALPRTLAEYDARMPGSPFGARNSEFPLLLLVHELGLAWALPMAMYFACCVPVKAILDGAPFSPAPSSPSSQNQTQPRPQSQY